MLISPTHTFRVANFGEPQFFPDPKPGNPERVQLTGDWVRCHLVEAQVPQLARFGVRHSVTAHYKAKEPLLALWQEWERLGLLDLVHSYDGLWNPRFKRRPGTEAERAAACAHLDSSHLSNHTWATAFDINARELPQGHLDADSDPFRQLVPVAEQFGWAWGGNFGALPDPMHFELARV